MAKTSCGVPTKKKTPQEVGMKINLSQAGGPLQKAEISALFAWPSSSQESVCDLCLSVTRCGNRSSWFQEHWEPWLVCCYELWQSTCFPLLSFIILPLSEGKPAHLVCRACRGAFRSEEQVFPCRMPAAHVSGRMRGRWYCLINHLNMPGVINACCILHNIWDSTGETLGVGRERKVNIFWTLWIDKDRNGVTIWSKKLSEIPSPSLLREKAMSGAWTHSNQRACVPFGFVRYGSTKNSAVSVRQAEMTEGGWKRRRNCVAFRWTGWLIPLGIKGERLGTAEISTGKRTSRNYYNSNRDQDKGSSKNESGKIVWSLSMILIP